MEKHTRAIHGKMNHSNHPDVTEPLHLSTTFKHGVGDFMYSRMDNPNRLEVEQTIAEIEQVEYVTVYSSGLAAINAVIEQLPIGSTIISDTDCYTGTQQLFDWHHQKGRINLVKINMESLEEVYSQIESLKPACVWIETPSNPLFRITDISRVSIFAHKHKAIVAVDCTWMTHLYQPAHLRGADVVVQSSTKYLGGHSDITGGVLSTNKLELHQFFKRSQVLQGAVPSPFDCWLLSRSLKTFPLRFREQQKSAEILALNLQSHPKIETVWYPSLLDEKAREIHAHQTEGNGAMISFLVKASQEVCLGVVNRSKIIANATSLGGVESLWEHRKSSEAETSTTPDNLIRLSVGLEDSTDLWKDIEYSLELV